MRLVERYIIQKNHWFYPEIYRLCFLSENLYNHGNYLVRQSLNLKIFIVPIISFKNTLISRKISSHAS